MATIYKGDIGVKIILNVVTDITGSSARKIYYKKPDAGDTGSWDADQESSTSISYTTTTDDIDEAGAWRLQAYVEWSGYKLYGAQCDLEVEEVIS
ncbi:MAG: hypothetical protein GTO16_13835 [Candidatus Aminicenantes bacterium]|nr:hypothetical protein [Candidatus Aminicenantes bacterium]